MKMRGGGTMDEMGMMALVLRNTTKYEVDLSDRWKAVGFELGWSRLRSFSGWL
jgi:hypothetical protein